MCNKAREIERDRVPERESIDTGSTEEAEGKKHVGNKAHRTNEQKDTSARIQYGKQYKEEASAPVRHTQIARMTRNEAKGGGMDRGDSA